MRPVSNRYKKGTNLKTFEVTYEEKWTTREDSKPMKSNQISKNFKRVSDEIYDLIQEFI